MARRHARRPGGGRSPSYEDQRRWRGVVAKKAPEWSDAAAACVLDGVKAHRDERGINTHEALQELCGNVEALDRYVRTLPLPNWEAELARSILSWHLREGLENDGTLTLAKCKSICSNLYRRNRERAQVQELSVDLVRCSTKGFAAWLSSNAESEWQRTVPPAMAHVLSRWPLGWLRQTAVMAYSRAARRVRNSRGGRAGAGFLKGCVYYDALPTAMAKDHYLVLEPGRAARFMTVPELARLFGVPARSPLRSVLAPPWFTANQAAECFGDSVHVVVAAQIVTTLLRTGKVARGLVYGSAWSSIDFFAAGVEKACQGHWQYAFASEKNRKRRLALAAAWRVRGLAAARCYADSTGEEAACAPHVDLFVATPECRKFSTANGTQTAEKNARALAEVWAGLEYVRRSRPKVVLVENVCTRSSLEQLTGLLCRLGGYTVSLPQCTPCVDKEEM